MPVLTPQLHQRNRLLPCGLLRDLTMSGVVRKPREIRALMLAALYCRFARAVVCPQRSVSGPQRRFRDRYSGVVEMSNLDAKVFGEGTDVALNANPSLGKLLAAISESLVEDAVVWAPPVVAPSRGKQPPIAVANQVPLALHRYLYPGDAVKAWTLAYRPGWQMSAAEVAAQVDKAFRPLVVRNRTTLIRACRTGREASLLSGIGTTRCGELRQQQGLLKP